MRGLLEWDGADALGTETDESPGRVELRRQIARLERELAARFSAAFGHTAVAHRVEAVAATPRLLDLGELERVRDELARRVSEADRALRERAALEAANRELLRRMLDDPAEFKWVRVSRREVGEPGCGGWHSQPRLGALGMLMGWWRVKVSSGCPLAGRLAAVERQAQTQASPSAPGSGRGASGAARRQGAGGGCGEAGCGAQAARGAARLHA